MELSASTYRTLFEDDPDGLVLVDPAAGHVRDCNQRFCELTDRDRERILGSDLASLVADASDYPVESLLEQRDTTGATVDLNAGTAGSTVRVSVRSSTVRLDDDTVRLLRMTELSRNDRDLELAQHLLETVPSGVFRTETDADGSFEYANPALASLLDVSSVSELESHQVSDFYADPSERAALVDALYETDAEQIQREVTLTTLDGDTKDVVVTAALCEEESGTEYIHKVVQEITDRKEREQALERYERLVESLPIGVFQNTPGPDGRFTFVNEAMVEIFDGTSKEHLREHSVRDLYVDPSEREAFSQQLLDEGVVTERELELRTLDGAELWGAVTAIARVVDGETMFDGVVQDITARKRYEQRLKEQRDDLDILNRMLRHDIRNDLQLVLAYADFLADHVDEEGHEYVETIRESTDHAVEITQTARDMADVMLSTEETLRPVALRTALEGELDAIRSKYSNVIVAVDGRIPETRVVANEMLGSVLRNLLKNAVQHNDSEIPEIRVSVRERAETTVVRIADNGPGVPDEQKDAVFGRGEKGLDSTGTGIGLYLVETLVERYGGAIRIEDNDPRGAVFVVELQHAT